MIITPLWQRGSFLGSTRPKRTGRAKTFGVGPGRKAVFCRLAGVVRSLPTRIYVFNKSAKANATTWVAFLRSSSFICSSARWPFASSKEWGPAP